MLNGLDLFSGIGGITLALQEWVRPIVYCENDRYAQAVLLSRMQEALLPRAPIWDDVSTLRGLAIESQVDIVYGGFPCQDLSVAGLGKGLEGERSGLFFEIMRLADELRPSFIFLENVSGIVARGLDRVTAEITKRGYDCRWTHVAAKEMGAPHKRERWFLLAHPKRIRPQGQGQYERPVHSEENQIRETSWPLNGGQTLQDEWDFEPDVGRVANGIPNRVERLKCLGNSVVPIQAREAFKRLMGL
jgi:DNA (cytosine-5)-methyltransferase 1